MLAPSLSLNFAKTKRLDPRITFTRASGATYFDKTGTLKTAPDNTARFTHDQITLKSLGLMIEESRTNWALYSRDMTNAAWVKTNITPLLNATGIDGAANTASTLTATNANATCLQSLTRTSTARQTSAYIKRKTGTGDIKITQDNGSTWTTVSISSTAWTRVSTDNATLANPTFGFLIAVSGDEIYVDYVQHEEGTHVTSPIKTTSASAARSAEVITMTGTNFSSWFNPTAGTFVCSGRMDYVATTSRGIWRIDDGTENNRIMLRLDGSGKLENRTLTSGSTVANLTGSDQAMIVGTRFMHAGAFEANNFGASFNGNIYTDTAGALPALTTLRIGDGSPSAASLMGGTIEKLVFYPVRLSDNQLRGAAS